MQRKQYSDRKTTENVTAIAIQIAIKNAIKTRDNKR